eukprot:gene20102-19251_t
MMLFFSICLSASLARASAEPWTTLQQAHMENVAGVELSSDGAWAAYTVSSTAGGDGALAATATTFVGGAGPSGKPSANIQTVCGKGCGQVAFSPDSSKVALVAGGILFLSSRDGASLAGADWTLPTQVYPVNKTDSVTYVVWSPDGSELGIGVQAQAAAPSPTLPRVVDEDVIVNVITNTHPGPATVLCTLPVVADDALTASAVATCYDTATLKGSLSMP